MDETGSIVKEGKFENIKDGIDGFFSGFAVTEVVMESTGFWWAVYEMLEARGYKVILAHLRADLIPESYIPTKHESTETCQAQSKPS